MSLCDSKSKKQEATQIVVQHIEMDVLFHKTLGKLTSDLETVLKQVLMIYNTIFTYKIRFK